MTDPTPLSPAAQAVMNAFVSIAGEGHRHQSAAVAAALRAAADQVVPEEPDYMRNAIPDAFDRQESIRAEILAIAAELGNNQ